MKAFTPKTANTEKQMATLKRDNVSTANSWIMLQPGGKLSIANQRVGGERTGCVTITKKEFERFIKFYETGE